MATRWYDNMQDMQEEGPATNGTFLQPNLACVASI
jgi:hypothetical protein